MCLRSLYRQTHPTDVDISFERGTAQARNSCVKRNLDKYDVFAFIDDDAIADERWIEELEKILERSDIVGGLILPKFIGDHMKSDRRSKKFPFWFSASLHPFIAINPISHHIYSCNLAVKREVFQAGCWFNEKLGRTWNDLGTGEETSLIHDARQKFTVGFCDTAIVYHLIFKEKLTAAYILKRFYWEGKSIARRNGKSRTLKGKIKHLVKHPQQLRFLPFHIGFIGGVFNA